jgi:hypothetical protein
MRQIGIIGATLVMVISLLGAIASGASAKEPLGGPLGCYAISNVATVAQAGNWLNGTCQQETGKLEANYVLALPVKLIKENLWCALLTPYEAGTPSETGSFASEECTGTKDNGTYIEVIWLKPPALVIDKSAPTVLISSQSDNPNNKIKSELQSTAAKLNGEGFLTELSLLTNAGKEISGIYTTLFLEVANGTTKCDTSGDRTGEVLVPQGEVSLVFDSLTVLGVAGEFTVPEFKIECGTLKLKVKGSVLGLITPINREAGAGSNTLQGALRCTSTFGQAAETKYWTNTGLEDTAKLEVTAGAGFELACELIGTTSTSTFSLLPNRVVEFIG